MCEMYVTYLSFPSARRRQPGLARQNPILHSRWELYDTRHAVFQPAKLSPQALETGYWRAYRNFYRWGSILKGACSKEEWSARLRHFAYAAGWKKFEFLWNFVIRTQQVASMLPVLEAILEEFGRVRSASDPRTADPGGTNSATLRMTGC